ncbi:MAG: hypothetical protein AB1445_05800 [Bacillota bacterium]
MAWGRRQEVPAGAELDEGRMAFRRRLRRAAARILQRLLPAGMIRPGFPRSWPTDCFFYLLAAANEARVDLASALISKEERNRARFGA